MQQGTVGGGRALPPQGEECKQEGGLRKNRKQAKYNGTHDHDHDHETALVINCDHIFVHACYLRDWYLCNTTHQLCYPANVNH